jgi:creatinine amidohydrolase
VAGYVAAVNIVPTTTSSDLADRPARVALLPIGSFEQHGTYLPLATDTMVACAVAEAVASTRPDVLVLPPVTVSCSHEHARWPGTVSISAATLAMLVNDVAESLRSSGIDRLVLVNGHGGNYVLSNVVQESNVETRRMALFPSRTDWERARTEAGLESTGHDDMHAGELETSVLLWVAPDTVRPGFDNADHVADRPDLLVLGMSAYTSSGVIGRPSLADAGKGRAVLASLAASFDRSYRLLVGIDGDGPAAGAAS